MSVAAFVLSRLPPPRARVLEVGCGAGELARALDVAGYDVTAIDPVAPKGPIFLRTRLEDFDDPGGFDAVVASRSLHHVHDLGGALDKLARLAHLLVLDEFVWDRFDRATGEWYDTRRREPGLPTAAEWEKRFQGLHGYEAMRTELRRRFSERFFSWEPYLYRYLHDPEAEEVERELIAAGRIQALGFRYVGVPLPPKTSG